MTELCHFPTLSKDVPKYFAQDPIIAKVMDCINNEWLAKLRKSVNLTLEREMIVSSGETGLRFRFSFMKVLSTNYMTVIQELLE